jgi:hypothetical protein
METLLAATDNDAYNSLVCAHYAPELGRQYVFQLATGEPSAQLRAAPAARGRTAFSEEVRFDELVRNWYGGSSFQTTRITEEYDTQAFLADLPADGLALAVIDPADRLRLLAAEEPLEAESDARVVWFGCKKECETRAPAGKQER